MMGHVFIGIALLTYFASFMHLANEQSAIGTVIVATLFVVCSVLCYLAEWIGDQLGGLNEQVLDIAADLAWLKETKRKENGE